MRVRRRVPNKIILDISIYENIEKEYTAHQNLMILNDLIFTKM